MSSWIYLLNNCCYFTIVIDALHESFNVLGIKNKIVERILDYNDEEHVYIVCTTHHFHERLPKRYIAYNFEQLITNKQWPSEFFLRLANAEMIWDYSIANINIIRQNVPEQTEIIHVPFGYAKCHENPYVSGFNKPYSKETHLWDNRNVCWVMLGNKSQFREEKLRNLSSRSDLSCINTSGCWGINLFRTYSMCRIGINVHFYPGNSILEVHRIIPMVSSGLLVITEHSQDTWYDNEYAGIVTFLPKGSLDIASDLSKTVDIINSCWKDNKDTIENMVRDRKALLVKRCSMENYVRKALFNNGNITAPKYEIISKCLGE